MKIYALKSKWKFWLALTAALIIVATLFYTNFLVNDIAREERIKVELWAKAVQNRAELVSRTNLIFKQFENEDRKNINLWAEANTFIAEYEGDGDIYFPTKILSNNTTIPVIFVNERDEILFSNNFPPEYENDSSYLKRKLAELKAKKPPIDVSYNVLGMQVKQYLYYDDSYLYANLRQTIDNLVQSFISETVVNAASVPVIITNQEQDSLLAFGNTREIGFDGSNPTALIAYMRTKNSFTVQLDEEEMNYIFYQDSYILSQLKIFPYILLAIVTAFLLVAYVLFSTARRSEQNQVWVGMSKETAHQLGTPLSSLIGWIELLKAKDVDSEALLEMEKDIERLQTVTERFSKIGSMPDLKSEKIYAVLQSSIDYMRRRTSQKITYQFIFNWNQDGEVPLNRPLFEWVLENLFRNAIDAIQGGGFIKIEVSEQGKHLAIDVTDSGKGIAKNQFKTIFRPGFTTKKRGWGLGLSLTKRIIEEYHRGKIHVKWSEIGVGTTFRILIRLQA